MPRNKFVEQLSVDCPTVKESVDALAAGWLKPVLDRLAAGDLPSGNPKVFNDPVWGTIELLPWEVVLLDSPLIQRLRGVRQLGLAHYVYPGGGHDRLEHARGVVEASERMLARLARNAKNRSLYGGGDQAIPQLGDEDHYVIRLAALLHDLGHGPFSHAIEPLIEQRYAGEFKRLADAARRTFDGVAGVSVSEAIAVLLVLSDAMDSVINHSAFGFPTNKANLAMRLVARIIGARSHLNASYLSGIVSGPVDADKLDYMARDGHHAGLSIGLDTDRLLSKLEVITITPENVPPRLSELKARAEASEQRRIYDMGISMSGIGAYEQMIVGRVVLYDRLYYHQKVRAADAMAQRLVQVAEMERGRPFTIRDLFLDVSDDTMVEVLGGRLIAADMQGGGERARELASCIRERRLYHRALAFASRFVGGLEGFEEEGVRDSERAALWRQVTRRLNTFEAITQFEREIYDLAREISHVDATLAASAAALHPEHVIVDLPANKARPSGNLLLTRTENDEVGLPNLYFDPERWSNAYDQQKRCGYVFCPREHIPLVSLASRIALFRRFRIGVTASADRFAKTSGKVDPAWIKALAVSGLVDRECEEQLAGNRVFLSRVEPEDLHWPPGWVDEKPELSKLFADEIAISRPGGFVTPVKEALIRTIEAVAKFVKQSVEGGEYAGRTALAEADLQKDLRRHLRTLSLPVIEGSEVGGGETDLIVDGQVLIENKVAGPTDDPMTDARPYPFQARRYAISLCKTVFLTVVAYPPMTETGVLRQTDSIRIYKLPDISEDCIEIRFAIPFATGRPSAVKKPPHAHSGDPAGAPVNARKKKRQL